MWNNRHLLLLMAAVAAVVSMPGTRTTTPEGFTKKEVRERKDLSEEGTESDYAKQFGDLRRYPSYAHPLYQSSNPWLPYQPMVTFPGASGVPPIDPYVLRLLTRYVRFLPQGLGLYGIYGSTGLPKVRPPGVFRFDDKDK